uniref:NAD(P)-binding domain-containing protein n=1 Tax=Tetradesmus obliquus TaxID=3088 RepID=A0A383VGD9_TETOB
MQSICSTRLQSKASVAVRSAVTRRTVALARPAQRRTLTKTAVAFDPQELQNLPKEVLLGGAAALAGLVGLIGYAAANNPAADMAGGEAAAAESAQAAAPAPLPRVNAVLVFGASGKLGRKVVERLVRSGRTVIAAVRSADKAAEVFEAAGLKEGYQQPSGNGSGSGGILITAAGVDVTNPATLSAELFEGVTQVVSALGPVAGRLPDGSFGYIDGMSPERVETQGMANIVAALAKHAPGIASAGSGISSSSILPMASAEDLAAWERLDDVIMGGNSSSALEAAADGSGAVWKGDLVVEGGGFCGARTKALDMDLSGYDGLQLRVKGDGQIFKFNIKTDQDATPESTYQATFDTSPEGDWTTDQDATPESTYQATFDTSPEGDWTTVRLPWSSFVPVKQAQSDPNRGPLDPARISKLGLVLSRFEFNKAPNPSYRPGKFQLAIDGSGISAYKAPRPAVVAISSAGVERNAIIGDDAAARKADIPIIQLNPGGVLNWKYEAECVLRASGLPYTVIRCTGLDDKGIEGPALLEADQGDTLIGVISRDEAADTVLAALARPEAANKTLELRRGEGAEAKGKSMNEARFNRLFLKLALDRNRWRVGLQPFPRAVPPPPPPSEERTKEILADPRVQAVKERESKAKEAEGVKEKELAKANA